MPTAKKIMVADDDSAILDAVSMMLTYAGYDVTTTEYGETLLSMQELPDLILLDIWMSGVDGRDICKQLKQQELTGKIPVVLISASREIEKSALDAGADDFLAKPFEMKDLIGKVKKYIGTSFV